MTMSLFHDLKLKRRKVDSRSSSDGSEVAATEGNMISPPSLASSSEVEDGHNRPSSQHSAFDVEVKPSKFELNAPRYTNWASPAKLKQEPYYEEAPTITATVVPKVFANGSSPSSSPLPSSSTASSHHRLPVMPVTSSVANSEGHNGGGHRLAEALRPPCSISAVHHLPLAAAAAAAKLQALHPNMVSSSHGIPTGLHHNPNLRMLTPAALPRVTSSISSIVKSEPIKALNSSAPSVVVSKNGSPAPTTTSMASSAAAAAAAAAANARKQGPSVILGEHGGVKTMIWTDSTTYWQAANKHRNNMQAASQQPQPLQQLQPPPPTSVVDIHRSLPPHVLPPPPISVAALKMERPDHEQLKMSSAVDGLLSLSSQGRPSPTRLTPPSQPSPHLMMSHPSSNNSSPCVTPNVSTALTAMSPASSGAPTPLPPHSQHDFKMNFSNPMMHQSQPQTQQPPRRRSPMNMERLWAGDLSQLPSHVVESQNGHMNLSMRPNQEQEDEEPLLCNICEDRATGLHYGIITCEGCKGFFKRTVQNKRVYSCVADGNCEINKAQRNRCQFCRFKKCLQQGMVLAAVREDRMPGGRNSGAVYNMYKVKYKKHKRANGNGTNGKSSSNPSTPGPPQTIPSSTSGMDLDPFRRPRSESSGSGMDTSKFMINAETVMTTCGLTPITTLPAVTSSPLEMYHNPNKGLLGGVNILRAALTGSNDIPQQYKNLGRQAKDKYEEHHAKLINELIECDEFDDIATLKNIGELLSQNTSDLEDKLCKIGDSIVHKLVEWVTRLPFYHQLPKEVHTKLLTHKWHELLVLTTSAYQAIHGFRRMGTTRTDGEKVELHQEVATNLVTLQTCLTSMMGKPITMDQLRQDVGNMVEKITKVIAIFRQFQLKMEEYVCLKVIAMVSQDDLTHGGTNPTLNVIHEKYLGCLRSFAKKHFPNQPNRVEELLVRLPEVQVAASLLLESKMFYVPFLLNSTID